MFWILTQQKMELIECSKIKIVQKTPTQFLMLSQNGEILGEYFQLEQAKNVLKKIENEIMYDGKRVFEMPENKRDEEK